MMITFLAQGRGNIHLAVNYCAGAIDANGMARDEVRVLRGSPRMVEDVAAALPFTEKYKSAVVAWAPGDIPTEAELEQLLDHFAEVSFAGLIRIVFAGRPFCMWPSTRLICTSWWPTWTLARANTSTSRRPAGKRILIRFGTCGITAGAGRVPMIRFVPAHCSPASARASPRRVSVPVWRSSQTPGGCSAIWHSTAWSEAW